MLAVPSWVETVIGTGTFLKPWVRIARKDEGACAGV